MTIKNEKLLNGVSFLKIPDEKNRFKTNRLSLSFIVPLNIETVSANAILPHILRRSCKDYPDFTALNQKLCDLYGARLFASVSNLGDNQILTLGISAIDDSFALNGEQVSRGCADLLCSLLFNPRIENESFCSEDFEAEKRQLIEQIQSEIIDKRSYAKNRLREQMCAGEPFAIGKLGTKETADALTNEAVVKAFNNIKKTAQIQIIMTGNQEEQPIIDAFLEGLKGLNRTESALTSIISKKPKTVRDFEEELDVNQAKLVMGFHTGIAEPDEAVFGARVMTALLGGTPHSRLFLNVRERLSLCYYCAAAFDKSKGIITVDSGLDEHNVPLAKEEIMNQLDFCKRGDFTNDELKSTKLSLQNSYRAICDNQGALEAYYLGQIFDKKIITPLEAVQKIEQVTRQQVTDCANNVTLDSVYLLKGRAEQ